MPSAPSSLRRPTLPIPAPRRGWTGAFLPTLLCLVLPVVAARAQAGFTVAPVAPIDTHDRAAVLARYHDLYVAEAAVPAGYTGSVARGVAGNVSEAYRRATLERINYYRAMAGLPGDVILDPALTQGCQEAALMMAAKGVLSHRPDPSWPFYTVAGAMAAANSSLTQSSGPAAIDAYMLDFGPANYYVGHRRWLIDPAQRVMGLGDVRDPSAGILNREANALWTDDAYVQTPPAPRDGYVAWPPPGFVPTPLIFPRWSFSLPGRDTGNLNLARVSVRREDNAPLTVTLEPTDRVFANYGDSTLVWTVRDPSTPLGSVLPEDVEHTYAVTVTIPGNLDEAARTFAYAVTTLPISTQPVPPPLNTTTVSVVAQERTFLFRRTGADLSAALVVRYEVGGAAVGGVDYKLLPGSKTIPAGAASVAVKIKVLPGATNPGSKIKLTLLPGDGYTLAEPASAKVKLATGQ